MEGATKKSRVLALSMRPHTLKDLIGQDQLIASIESQFKSTRLPHFFILSGPCGGGKTTIARILALRIQNETSFDAYKKYDIREINAANQTGVDEMRAVIESMRFQPISPSKAKVVIFDEAHQLSVPAQNVLITETEDVKPHVFYIFCTSIPSKIIDALKRRAFHITPVPLNPEARKELVTLAALTAEFTDKKLEDLLEYLSIEDITSPGLVLQACERFFLGLSPSSIASSSLFESLSMCRAVANGNWEAVRDLCKNLTKSDVPGLKASVCGYLKSILLKSTLANGMPLANAIKIINDAEELPVFVGSLFTVCGILKK
jgi:DNA polymerase III delta prime subunit